MVGEKGGEKTWTGTSSFQNGWQKEVETQDKIQQM